MTTQSSTPTKGRPMTFTCNLETFIAMFDTETDAIDHILLASDDGRVETTMYTIPYYTFARCLQSHRPTLVPNTTDLLNRHALSLTVITLHKFTLMRFVSMRPSVPTTTLSSSSQ